MSMEMLSDFQWVDYVIIGVITVSTLISLFRGFSKEAISLATWVIAIWLVVVFVSPVAELLTDYIHTPSLRMIAAGAGIFIVTLIIGGIFNAIFSKLVKGTGLGGMDRLLGMIFGFVRGVLFVSLLLLLLSLTSVPKDPWWTNSVFIPYFMGLVDWLRQYVPEHILRHTSSTALQVPPVPVTTQ